MVIHIRSQCSEDPPIVTFDLAVAFPVIRFREVIMNRHHLIYIDEELRRKQASVVCYEFFLKTIVNATGINKVSGHLRCQNKFRLHNVRHITKLVSNYQEMFIGSFSLDEFAENINAHRC